VAEQIRKNGMMFCAMRTRREDRSDVYADCIERLLQLVERPEVIPGLRFLWKDLLHWMVSKAELRHAG
jgi:hypothetical protein